MPSGNPRQVAVNVRGSDDSCCGVFFLKYVLYIFNFILLLSGAAILAVGLWMFFDKRWLAGLLAYRTNDFFIILVYSLIGIGGFIVVLTFSVGCCGAVRKNRCCLMFYSFLLLVVFLLEASHGVLTFMYESKIHQDLAQLVNNTLLHRYGVDATAKASVDYMQSYKRCCGTTVYSDWFASDWHKATYNNDTQAVPDSCCKTLVPGCGSRTNPNNINHGGCLTHMEDELRIHLNIMSAMGMGLCCLQIFGIVFACCLAKRVRKWAERNDNSFWQQ
jgi:hypothetical protein